MPCGAQQVLATLDPEPYRLNVQAAEAELRAGARLPRPDTGRLRAPPAAAGAARGRAGAVRDGATQLPVGAKPSRCRRSPSSIWRRRDLRNTTLIAPFDGSIAERLIDPFVEVQAGQTVFRIDAKGGMQAAIGVPETTIAQLVLGMPATVTVPQSLGAD